MSKVLANARCKDRVRPFYCGTQSLDWEIGNCTGCTKACTGEENDVREMPCLIMRALFFACWGDGTISHKIADMMGRPEDRYSWPCPSRDPMWLDFALDADAE